MLKAMELIQEKELANVLFIPEFILDIESYFAEGELTGIYQLQRSLAEEAGILSGGPPIGNTLRIPACPCQAALLNSRQTPMSSLILHWKCSEGGPV